MVRLTVAIFPRYASLASTIRRRGGPEAGAGPQNHTVSSFDDRRAGR
jgi:hypothetical protein